ncbi:50S ribosomal protein L11 methyltransferase [Veillonella criceti]|uniref:Ribosomal protein L11 methyltransferase n=1 Tax=Veillonella criceti TaxID=103891 RepID=A0A380NH95_9FIRM|nr:50S ribosomal protein L11 methyltransferase [Veillonella criceti]SUP41062.1 Ribosomal protein L11 methyltransferase [Veillonella criceti]
MKWIEISVAIERVVIEEVTTLFDTMSSNGFIEEDVPNEPNWVQFTLYGDTSKSTSEWEELIGHELKQAQFNFKQLQAKEVTDTDWYNSWQQYIEPTEILPNLVIRPAWKEYTPKQGEEVITIDSDLSFGTGAHETTQACAELMAKYGAKVNTCLDIGTGTGILLLVAHYLGVPNLIGIDIDASAVAQAKANCETNAVTAQLICGDLATDFTGTADLILANLTVDPLKMLLPAISKKLDSEGILIISGIIDDRYEEIKPYIEAHWLIVEEVTKESWHTFALKYKG